MSRRILIWAIGALALLLLIAVPACIRQPPPLPEHLTDSTRDYSTDLPIFPGAEGFGADTPAGRGGAILHVTTLGPEGPGSLRAALDTTGPRTIVFDVTGIITLTTPLEVRHPFVTVAGQTAPGKGITITGAPLTILTHDVLIQHLRLRIGDAAAGPPGDARDGLNVLGAGSGATPAERVVIDHCSISWGIDENASTWGAGVYDVTFSHCIISECLSHSLHSEGEHSKGMLIGNSTRRVSVIRCLFAHNTERHPLIKGDTTTLIVNNIVYNPGELAIHFSDPEGVGPCAATLINNTVIAGPDTPWWMPVITVLNDVKPATRIYSSGNAMSGHLDFVDIRPTHWLREIFRPLREPLVQLKPLTILPTGQLLETVLAKAGARPAARDDVDKRIVNDVRNRTGEIIDSPAEVGGLPPAAPDTVPFEEPPNPNNDDDNDGYTNLEERLHELAHNLEQQ